MRSFLVLILLFFCVGQVFGQLDSTDKIMQYNKQMYSFNKRAWLTIGGVSVVGSAVSVPGILLSSDLEMKSFHQMNAIYYGINLVFAVPGYIAARKKYRNSSSNIKGTYLEQIRNEKTYLLNMGLDLFYTATGFLCRTIGKGYPDKQPIFNGVGNSLIVQSLFLFAVDASMTIAHSRHRKNKFDTMVEWGVTPNGVGLKLKL